MALGYSYVKAAVGELLHGYVHAASYGHGGCDAYDPGVLSHEFQQGLAEHILEERRLACS